MAAAKLAVDVEVGHDRFVAARPCAVPFRGSNDTMLDTSLRDEPKPNGDRPVEVRLHRRRQMVVVRAGDSQADIDPVSAPGRRRMPTLIGLDYRERLETLREDEPDWGPSRLRPTVLVDGVDDDLAQVYRAEAERILREGLLQSEGEQGPRSGINLRASEEDCSPSKRSWWQELWRGTLVRAG